MRLHELAADDPLLPRVYTDLLAPAFPPAELVSLDSLRQGLTHGTTVVTATVQGRTPSSVVIGDYSPASGVLLLSYLAVAANLRSRGVGGRLLREVTGPWQARYRPCLTLAEVEHPAAHAADPLRGDPAARLRFYARHGSRALDLPYFQPALSPETGRVYGFLMLVLAYRDGGRGRLPETVSPEPVHRFLTDYFLGTEGGLGADPAATALWQAVDRPDGIPLLPLDDPSQLPISTASDLSSGQP